jgi:hypothetical protein
MFPVPEFSAKEYCRDAETNEGKLVLSDLLRKYSGEGALETNRGILYDYLLTQNSTMGDSDKITTFVPVYGGANSGKSTFIHRNPEFENKLYDKHIVIDDNARQALKPEADGGGRIRILERMLEQNINIEPIFMGCPIQQSIDRCYNSEIKKNTRVSVKLSRLNAQNAYMSVYECYGNHRAFSFRGYNNLNPTDETIDSVPSNLFENIVPHGPHETYATIRNEGILSFGTKNTNRRFLSENLNSLPSREQPWPNWIPTSYHTYSMVESGSESPISSSSDSSQASGDTAPNTSQQSLDSGEDSSERSETPITLGIV